MRADGVRWRGRSLAVVVTAVVLGVAGCGSSDSSSDGASGGAATGAPTTADPSTLEGGCEILLGDERVLDATLEAAEGDDAERSRVQERLFAIVAAENDSLGDAAGQLVDYLDDPSAYVEDGELSADVSAAVADVRETCDVL